MTKARNKKFSLIMALVFAFTMVFPIGLAFADDVSVSYSTAKNLKYDGTTAQSLGYIRIDDGDLSTVSEVYIDITLPDDVDFNNTLSDSSDLITGGTVTSYSGDSDEYSIVVTPAGSTDLVIRFDTDAKVKIKKSAASEIKVRLEAKAVGQYGGEAWSIDNEYVLGRKGTGDITAKAATPESLKYGSGKDIAKITIMEAYAGQLQVGDTISIELPSDDFAWYNMNVSTGYATVSGKYGLAGTAALNADDSDILDITITNVSSPFASELEIKAQVTVYPNASDGDVDVDVSSDNSDFDSVTLAVAVIGDSDVTVTADEDTGMEDYMRKASINELWELTFESNGTFAEGDEIIINLPDGFKFVSPAANGSANMETADVGDDVDNNGLFNSKKSIWLEINSTGAGKDEITIDNLWVAALPDCEYGDIEIEITGDVVNTTVVAGYVKPAITIAADKAAVEVGLAEPAGNITLTETDKDALPNDMIIYATLPKGVEFKSTPTVEVNGDEIDEVVKGPDAYDDNVLEITLSKLSNSKIDTIVISDIEYTIDDRYDVGDEIALSIGGKALKDMVNQLPNNSQFEDEYDDAIVKVVNAVLKDKNAITAAFKVGDEGVAVMNGRTLVQVNMLCDELGLQKSWDAATKTAYFVKDGKVVAFPMGENAIYISGVKLPVDQGGVIVNGYTYATLRGIQAAFGGELAWDGATKTATFNFNK